MNTKKTSRIKSLEEKHKLLDQNIRDLEDHHDSYFLVQQSKKIKLRLKEQIENLKNTDASHPD